MSVQDCSSNYPLHDVMYSLTDLHLCFEATYGFNFSTPGTSENLTKEHLYSHCSEDLENLIGYSALVLQLNMRFCIALVR
jgi:hypothetical protein